MTGTESHEIIYERLRHASLSAEAALTLLEQLPAATRQASAILTDGWQTLLKLVQDPELSPMLASAGGQEEMKAAASAGLVRDLLDGARLLPGVELGELAAQLRRRSRRLLRTVERTSPAGTAAMRRRRLAVGSIVILALALYSAGSLFLGTWNPRLWAAVRLDGLVILQMRQDLGGLRVDRSVAGWPLTVAGRRFEHGLGTHAESVLRVHLPGGQGQLSGLCGVDDGGKKGSVRFLIQHGHDTLFDSGVMRAGEAARGFSVNVSGLDVIALRATDAGDGKQDDHADWLNLTVK